MSTISLGTCSDPSAVDHDNWHEDRRALSAHIEEGYVQAVRGELIDAAQAKREIQAMKDEWRRG